MNEAYTISKMKLIEEFKKKSEKYLNNVKVRRGRWHRYFRGYKYQKINHLSTAKYETYRAEVKERPEVEIVYYVWNIETECFTSVALVDVEPKSIREKLHNIEIAKKFYKKQTLEST